MRTQKSFLFLLVFFLFVRFFVATGSDNLITIDGEKQKTTVPKEDFLHVYKKNHAVQNKSSMQDYLELYVNFLLKVTEAKAMGMDTLPAFQSEFSNYKSQLAEPYLRDDQVRDSLKQQLFAMSKDDRRISHIMFRVDFDQTLPEDTMKLYQELEQIRKKIVSDELSFAEAAARYSEDKQSGLHGGDLGWFNVFKFPYAFEKAAHDLTLKEVSEPVRTRFGYHLLQLTDHRKAAGEVKVAHIIKIIPQQASETQKDSITALVNDLYAQLESGDSFADLASAYSDDQRSRASGGELPWLSTGQMISEFEEQAFSLEKTGDYSEPFQSSFGWHIVQLVDRRAPPPDEKVMENMERKMEDKEFAVFLNKAFLHKLRKDYQYQSQPAHLEAFYALDKDFFSQGAHEQVRLNPEIELVSFADTILKGSDFLSYLKENKQLFGQLKMPMRNFIDRIFVRYTDEVLLAYEKNQLENKYEDYRMLLQEYHDGILLFNIMDDKVWSRAITDTVGLKAFYNKNKDMYQWEERLLTQVYQFNSEEQARYFQKELQKAINKGKGTASLENKFNRKFSDEASLQSWEEKYLKEDGGLVQYLDWSTGISNVIEEDGVFYVLYAQEKIDPETMQLSEAKGKVVSDYQDMLEKEWLQELHDKYEVDINRSVLSSLVDEF